MSRRRVADQQPAAGGVEACAGRPGRCRRGRAAPRRARRAPLRPPPRPPRRPPPSAARSRSRGRVAASGRWRPRAACRRRPRRGRAPARRRLVKNSMRRAMSRGGLLAPWALRAAWPSSDGIGRRQQRLREVEPLLAAQLVERVGGVDRPVRGGQRSSGTPEVCGSAAALCFGPWRSWAGSASWPSWPRPCAASPRAAWDASCSPGRPGIGCTRLLDELSARHGGRAGRGAAAAVGPTSLPWASPTRPSATPSRVPSRRLPDERLADVVGRRRTRPLPPGAGPRRAPRPARHRPARPVAHRARPARAPRRRVDPRDRSSAWPADGVLLLILEDIHLADPATRGLIEALCRPWVARCRSASSSATSPTCCTAATRCVTLADWLADDPDAAAPRAAARCRHADIEQLVRGGAAGARSAAASCRPSSRARAATRSWRSGWPRAPRRSAGVRLSDPFDELCGARLEALPRDAARVVRVLAAARCPCRAPTLLRVQLPEGRLTIQGLEAALESGFVHRGRRPGRHRPRAARGGRRGPGADAGAPRASTPRWRSRRQASPALAAWHWSRAARPAEARDASIRAATAALLLDPAETVLAHYEEALELPGIEDMTPEERAALLAGAAAASASAGQFRRAVALQRRAIESRATREASPRRGVSATPPRGSPSARCTPSWVATSGPAASSTARSSRWSGRSASCPTSPAASAPVPRRRSPSTS